MYSFQKQQFKKAFEAKFNKLKLNSIDYIRAYALAYSFIYKTMPSFTSLWHPCVNVRVQESQNHQLQPLNKHLDFMYVSRNPKGEYAVPGSNTLTNELLVYLIIRITSTILWKINPVLISELHCWTLLGICG